MCQTLSSVIRPMQTVLNVINHFILLKLTTNIPYILITDRRPNNTLCLVFHGTNIIQCPLQWEWVIVRMFCVNICRTVHLSEHSDSFVHLHFTDICNWLLKSCSPLINTIERFINFVESKRQGLINGLNFFFVLYLFNCILLRTKWFSITRKIHQHP